MASRSWMADFDEAADKIAPQRSDAHDAVHELRLAVDSERRFVDPAPMYRPEVDCA